MRLLKLLEECNNLLSQLDANKSNVPIGITLTGIEGKYFLIYSISDPVTHSSLETIEKELEDFLTSMAIIVPSTCESEVDCVQH